MICKDVHFEIWTYFRKFSKIVSNHFNVNFVSFEIRKYFRTLIIHLSSFEIVSELLLIWIGLDKTWILKLYILENFRKSKVYSKLESVFEINKKIKLLFFNANRLLTLVAVAYLKALLSLWATLKLTKHFSWILYSISTFKIITHNFHFPKNMKFSNATLTHILFRYLRYQPRACFSRYSSLSVNKAIVVLFRGVWRNLSKWIITPKLLFNVVEHN